MEYWGVEFEVQTMGVSQGGIVPNGEHGGGLVAQSCPTLVTPWTGAHEAPLSIGFSGKNTAVGCHFLPQEIFLTQGSSPGFLYCRQILY